MWSNASSKYDTRPCSGGAHSSIEDPDTGEMLKWPAFSLSPNQESICVLKILKPNRKGLNFQDLIGVNAKQSSEVATYEMVTFGSCEALLYYFN